MKKLWILLPLLCGCATHTKVTIDRGLITGEARGTNVVWTTNQYTHAEFDRHSAAKVGIGKLIVATNGTVTLEGYANDGGTEALKAIGAQLKTLAAILESLSPKP